jgi:hypothetical protein
MKIRLTRTVDFKVVAIKCEMAVCYGEKDIPNDFPLRKGDMWVGTVDVDTGVIFDWPAGKSGRMDMKVRDKGTYTLIGPDGEVLSKKENEYVPGCIPGEEEDYVIFDIDVNGKIARWGEFCTEENIEKAFGE